MRKAKNLLQHFRLGDEHRFHRNIAKRAEVSGFYLSDGINHVATFDDLAA